MKRLSEFLRRTFGVRLDGPSIALFVFALGGALGFVWPLLTHPEQLYLDRTYSHDSLMNIDDLRAVHANLWRALSSGNFFDSLYDSNFYYPQPRALVTSELQLIAAIVTLPFSGHPVLAHSVLLVAALFLNCVGGARFAEELGATRWSRLVAGVAFAFCSYTGFQSGRVQLLYLFPIPFALAWTLRWSRTGRPRHALGVGVWLAVLMHLCLYYALFAAIVLPAFALAMRLSTKRQRVVRDLAVLGCVTTAVCGLSAVPLWPYAEFSGVIEAARIFEAQRWTTDLKFFLWSDSATIWRNRLSDQAHSDTALFPGMCVLVLAAWTLATSIGRRWSSATVFGVFVAVVGLPFAGLSTAVWPTALVLAVLSVVLSRMGKTSTATPALAVLFVVGFFLFGGHNPNSWQQPIDGRPYAWLAEHVRVIYAIRVTRRAGILVQLGIGVLAALAFSRVRTQWRVAVLSIIAAAIAYLEAVPVELTASRIDIQCTDEAYEFARSEGIREVVEQVELPESHAQRTVHRYQAGLCGVKTSVGQSGMMPPLITTVDDAVQMLPDASAHAWLWDAGVRWILLRGGRRWRDVRVAMMTGHSSRVLESQRTTFVELTRPTLQTTRPPAELPGDRVEHVRAQCSAEQSTCAYLVDRDPRTRWTSGTPQNGREHIELTFSRQRIRGIVWHVHGVNTDTPRALKIEYRIGPNEYREWGTFRPLSPFGIGRHPRAPSMAIAMPPVETDGLRLTQLSRSRFLFLSASEIDVVRAP